MCTAVIYPITRGNIKGTIKASASSGVDPAREDPSLLCLQQFPHTAEGTDWEQVLQIKSLLQKPTKMYVYSPLLCRELRAPRQMPAVLNGSQPQAFPLRVTQHLGAENWCGESPVHLMLLFYRNKKHLWIKQPVFELLFSYPSLNPNPFPVLQAPKLTFPKLLSACTSLFLPSSHFLSKDHTNSIQLPSSSPCKQPHSTKGIWTPQLGYLTLYLQTFKQETEFPSIRNKI